MVYFALALYTLIILGLGAQLAPPGATLYDVLQAEMQAAVHVHNAEICWDAPPPARSVASFSRATTATIMGESPEPEQPSLYALGMWHLKHTEGLRLKPYNCAAGVRTIGWGHAIRPSERFTEITVQEADSILAADFKRRLDAVRKRYPNIQERHRQWAIAMLAFNLRGGVSGLKGSKLERYILASDWDAAADQLLKWDKALNPATGKHRSLRGLKKKREFEALLLRGDPSSLGNAFAKADYLRDGVIEQIRKQVQ